MFARRLTHLNNEKFGLLVKTFSNDMFDTLDKQGWSNL